MPFSEATLDFMALNRVMNSREWFHAHREEYLKLVVEPTAGLVEALAPAMWEIDPSLIIIPKVGKSISRIWRDTRRGPELPIYRDVMWITLLRAKYENYPSFWFEYSPQTGWLHSRPLRGRMFLNWKMSATSAPVIRTRRKTSVPGWTRRASASLMRKLSSAYSTPRNSPNVLCATSNASCRSMTSSSRP